MGNKKTSGEERAACSYPIDGPVILIGEDPCALVLYICSRFEMLFWPRRALSSPDP